MKYSLYTKMQYEIFHIDKTMQCEIFPLYETMQDEIFPLYEKMQDEIFPHIPVFFKFSKLVA